MSSASCFFSIYQDFISTTYLLSNIISEFRNTTRVVFICNDCTQIIESIQSRCMIIKYPRISKIDLYNKKVDIYYETDQFYKRNIC